jgi:hypothetical protein
MLVLGGCSSSYHIRLSDDRSASYGELFFFGWADPALIPGVRLVDAPPGSRIVLWNEGELEAIVDLGETCPVLVRDGDGARAPTVEELSVLAAVFPAWPLVPSAKTGEYAAERRLERRFPSHVRASFEALDPAAKVELALGNVPAVEHALFGRAGALVTATVGAPAALLPRILDRALELPLEDRYAVLWAMVEHADLKPEFLVRIARAGAPVMAAHHKAADESVCLAAVEEIAKEPLSSNRRSGLEAVLDSPGVTPRVREEVLKVPLAYPADREAVGAKAGKSKVQSPR